jgi:predicted Zn-dependent protease with MMP-like domain
LSERQDKNVRKAIEEVVKQFKNHRHEVFLKVNDRNERIYITPVRDEHGNLVGYFERFEKNFTKT